MSGRQRIVDDRHPTILYDMVGQWSQAGVGSEYRSTTTWTDIAGAKAVVAFTGTRISVFGTIPGMGTGPSSPVTLYLVDKNTPVTFEGARAPNVQYRVPFYTSPTLPAGNHVLEITNVGRGHVFLDYFVIEDDTARSPPAVPDDGGIVPTATHGSPGTKLHTTTSGMITITEVITVVGSTSSASPTNRVVALTNQVGTPSTSPTDVAQSQTPSSSPSQVVAAVNASSTTPSGTIVGGVLGGIAGLILVAVGIFLLLRMKKRRKAQAYLSSAQEETPFTTQNEGATVISQSLYPVHLPPPPTESDYPREKQPELPSMEEGYGYGYGFQSEKAALALNSDSEDDYRGTSRMHRPSSFVDPPPQYPNNSASSTPLSPLR